MMLQIQPYKTILNPENAYWMAKISKEIYSKKSEDDPSPDSVKILQALKSIDGNFLSVKGYSKNSSQAGLIAHNDYICMAFRGTDEISDWLDNINAFPHTELFGKFHRGFWNALNDIWIEIIEDYYSLMSEKKRPVFFTGHSLGGAMANIAAAKLIHDDKPFTSVYTFGQPRAMTRSTSRIFNAECKSRYFRFQNNNDVVPRIPSRFMGYSHVGSFVYITEEKELHDDPGFWFQFLDHVDGAIESIAQKGLDGIEDHNMDNYLKAVENWNCTF